MQGTTTNGEYMLDFRSGAFLAGVPVQPVILRYQKVKAAPGYDPPQKVVDNFIETLIFLFLTHTQRSSWAIPADASAVNASIAGCGYWPSEVVPGGFEESSIDYEGCGQKSCTFWT